jgi:hypothetical protein
MNYNIGMRVSRFISTLALFCGMFTGYALFRLEYEWASKAAGLWVLFYYTFIILDEYENKE